MKRALLENCKVLLEPGVIDREGFLSAIFALKAAGAVGEGAAVSVRIEHSDTEDGGFTAVEDAEVFPSLHIKDPEKAPGIVEGVRIAEGEVINIDVDLVGCKRYVKITAVPEGGSGDGEGTVRQADGEEPSQEATEDAGGAAGYLSAVVLGDSSFVPV